MKSRFTRTFLACLFLSLTAGAQTVYTPVFLAGYNQDIIANGTGPASGSTTISEDIGSPTVLYDYVAEDFVNSRGETPTSWLPDSAIIWSVRTPGLKFQLGDYSDVNSLRLMNTDSGGLLLGAPTGGTELWVAAAGGNGGPVMRLRIHFTDGTIQTTDTVTVPDWYDGPRYAIAGVSRVNRATDDIFNPVDDPRIYEFRFPIDTVNYTKLIDSVSIIKVTDASSLNVLALTLGSNCPFAPRPGITSTEEDSICLGSAADLALHGFDMGGTIFRQWQTSTDTGRTWTDLTGKTDTTLQDFPNQTTWYRVRLNCGPRISYSTTVTVLVATPAVARIAYDQPAYCASGFSAPPVTLTPAGGRFLGQHGIVVDSVTGILDLGASTPGRGQVLYTRKGLCTTSAQTNVTINPVPVISVVYSDSVYCGIGSTPAPTLTPASGAFMDVPTGLVIDTGSGVVDLAASTPGRYTVVYSAGGSCLQSDTAGFRIKSGALPRFPNLILPNGSSVEDQTLHFAATDLTGYSLTIVNSWGKQVFTSSDPAEAWTATEVPAGVYFYRVTFSTCSGQPADHKSWVEVVK